MWIFRYSEHHSFVISLKKKKKEKNVLQKMGLLFIDMNRKLELDPWWLTFLPHVAEEKEHKCGLSSHH